MELKEIFEELKSKGVDVVKDSEQGTFTRFRLIGPGFDSDESWVWWQIKDAYERGGLYLKEEENMKKFDSRIKPGSRVLLAGYGRRNWYTVKLVHSTRKWVKVEGLLGRFQHKDVIKFSNSK